jgi:hypothetical protein
VLQDRLFRAAQRRIWSRYDSTRKMAEEVGARILSQTYRFPGGYRRIYHYHIHKTAGTSLNLMFLWQPGHDGPAVYHRLGATPNHRVIDSGKVFVGWHIALIQQGYYYYGFSHAPAHGLTLPPGTFTFVCLRDPVARVLSHYQALYSYRALGIQHPALLTEGQWLGSSFADFLLKLPREYLMRQLYMFSPTFDVSEAVARALQCSQVLFQDELLQGIVLLRRALCLDLQPVEARATPLRAEIREDDVARLRTLLTPEMDFVQVLRTAIRERHEGPPVSVAAVELNAPRHAEVFW